MVASSVDSKKINDLSITGRGEQANREEKNGARGIAGDCGRDSDAAYIA